MRCATTLFALFFASTTPFAAANIGHARVHNNCADPVHYRTYNQQSEINSGILPQGQQVHIDYGAANDGVCVKLDWTGAFDNHNLYQFEFVDDGEGSVWYDLSAENGDPLANVVRSVTSNMPFREGKCGPIHCAVWDESCAYTPDKPAYNPVQMCTNEAVIQLTLC